MEHNARLSCFIGWPLEAPATKLIYWHSGMVNVNKSDELFRWDFIFAKEKVTMIIKYITPVNVRSGDLEGDKCTFFREGFCQEHHRSSCQGQTRIKMSFINIYIIHVNKWMEWQRQDKCLFENTKKKKRENKRKEHVKLQLHFLFRFSVSPQLKRQAVWDWTYLFI